MKMISTAAAVALAWAAVAAAAGQGEGRPAGGVDERTVGRPDERPTGRVRPNVRALAAADGTANLPVIAAGGNSSFAIDASGNLFGWGNDAYGELGLGSLLRSGVPVRVSGEGRYVQVAVGAQFALALRADGSLWAWGINTVGQLGDGTYVSRNVPTRVGEGYVAIAAASEHAVALKSDGTLWTWGGNSGGQLGDGTTTTRSRPLQVGSGFQSIAVGGDDSTVAVKSDGTLWAWGGNYWGQLGDGTSIRRTSPVQIGSGFFKVFRGGGEGRSFALKRDGTLWAWGINGEGQLGDGTTTLRTTPVPIGAGYSSVAAGLWHTVALKTDGSLWAWGSNSSGQFGDGSTTVGANPTPRLVGSGYVSIAAGSWDSYTLAVKSDGSLWAWGQDLFQQLGHDGVGDDRCGKYSSNGVLIDLPCRKSPIQIGSGFVAVDAGRGNSFEGPGGGVLNVAIKNDGSLWAWGSNNHGELGIARSFARLTPTLVGTGYRRVATEAARQSDAGHSAAVKNDGSLWTWGTNAMGQLGDGTQSSRSLPAPIGTGYADVAVGSWFTVALKTDGSIWSWGSDQSGELGIGNPCLFCIHPAPVRVGGNFAAIAAGMSHVLALKTDGTLWAWGHNFYGQLGNGGIDSRSTPVQIEGSYTAISAAGVHSVALKSDGTLWAWGSNSHGQLGDGSFTNRNRPVKVGSGFSAIAAGGDVFGGHTVALKADGSLWTWGKNDFGQLGDGKFVKRAVPQQVGAGYSAIAAGKNHTLAYKADGSLWSWGGNLSGQLGNGSLSTTLRELPVVNEAATGLLALAGTGGLPAAADVLTYLVKLHSRGADISASITDLRAAGLLGDVYFTALLPGTSPLLGCAGACPAGGASTAPRTALATADRRGSLEGLRPVQPLAGSGAAMLAGVLARGGFKQTGGTGNVQADPAYSGDLGRAGTLEVWSGVGDVLADSNAVICMGVTVPELSAKGQVLMRPIATGSAVQGVVQCPPVQTAATINQFRVEASGPITARTIVAQINPLAEDRGKLRRIFSWAVTPDGRQYMQTGPNLWEDMSEPMLAAATVTLPAAGPYRFEVTRNLNLSAFPGTLVFIGIGDSWEDVRRLNKAGNYYRVE